MHHENESMSVPAIDAHNEKPRWRVEMVRGGADIKWPPLTPSGPKGSIILLESVQICEKS